MGDADLLQPWAREHTVTRHIRKLVLTRSACTAASAAAGRSRGKRAPAADMRGESRVPAATDACASLGGLPASCNCASPERWGADSCWPAEPRPAGFSAGMAGGRGSTYNNEGMTSCMDNIPSWTQLGALSTALTEQPVLLRTLQQANAAFKLTHMQWKLMAYTATMQNIHKET